MDIFDKDTQEFLIKAGKPVLLEGPHGVGKTSVLRSLASNFGLKLHEINAATLDPFVHIVGIPVAHEGKVTMTPPDELLNAELLFIDEVNRADRPTRNAMFELICDHSVNGRKLPNLKLVVGAMNPADDDYQVDALDIAMEDRFLYKFKVGRDISYALQHLPPDKHPAVHKWYEALEEPPSPRRLTWALETAVHEGKINEPALLNALDDSRYSTTSLLQMLSMDTEEFEKLAKDPLLSEDEKVMLARVVHILVDKHKQQLTPDLIEKIKSFEEWLPSPDASLSEGATPRQVFDDSEFLQEFDKMITFTITMPSSFPTLEPGWASKAVQ